MKEYLKQYKETMPTWLANYKKGDSINIDEVFSSHVVYYPGSGDDGQPIETCVQASCSHVFLYVDYGITRKDLENKLVHPGFRGYSILDTIEISEKDLAPKGWHPHVNTWKKSLVNDKEPYSLVNFVNYAIKRRGRAIGEEPYSFMYIFERQEGLTDEHGAKRFAIIFLFADGIASYDELFGNKNIPTPFLVVLQDHGSGGNYDKFGKGGLMEKIAIKTDSFPKLLIVGDNTPAWNGYSNVNCEPVKGGEHKNPRHLFEKMIKM